MRIVQSAAPSATPHTESVKEFLASSTPLLFFLAYEYYEGDLGFFVCVFGRLPGWLGTCDLDGTCSWKVRKFCRGPEVGEATPTSGTGSRMEKFSGSIFCRPLENEGGFSGFSGRDQVPDLKFGTSRLSWQRFRGYGGSKFGGRNFYHRLQPKRTVTRGYNFVSS